MKLISIAFVLLAQGLPELPEVKGETNSLLIWIITVLGIFCIGLIVYFKVEIKSLKSDLKEERTYNRTQDGNNIALIEVVNITLKQVVKLLDKNVDGISGMQNAIDIINPIIQKNADRLEVIKDKVIKGNER